MPHVITPRCIVDGHLYALYQSDWIDARVLTAGGAAESFQAPTGAKFVMFSANGNFHCRLTDVANGSAVAATVPGADITDGSAAELNPAMRVLPGNDQAYISLISPTGGATVVTMMFFH